MPPANRWKTGGKPVENRQKNGGEKGIRRARKKTFSKYRTITHNYYRINQFLESINSFLNQISPSQTIENLTT